MIWIVFRFPLGAGSAGRGCCSSCSKGRIKDLLELCDSTYLLRIDLRAFLSLLFGGRRRASLQSHIIWQQSLIPEGGVWEVAHLLVRKVGSKPPSERRHRASADGSRSWQWLGEVTPASLTFAEPLTAASLQWFICRFFTNIHLPWEPSNLTLRYSFT